jgi:hypothetical protein
MSITEGELREAIAEASSALFRKLSDRAERRHSIGDILYEHYGKIAGRLIPWCIIFDGQNYLLAVGKDERPKIAGAFGSVLADLADRLEQMHDPKEFEGYAGLSQKKQPEITEKI